jgi:hypothetical protein
MPIKAGLRIAALLPLLSAAASADFSYVRTTTTSAHPEAQTTKEFLKGRKLCVEQGDLSSIVDLAAGTITTINRKRKVYTVRKLPENGASNPAIAGVAKRSPDIRESGKRKKIEGFAAKEVLLTTQAGASPITGAPMQLEADLWLSSDVPGTGELRAFQRVGRSLSGPGAAGGGLQKVIADLQQKAEELDGMPLVQVVTIRAIKDGPAMLEITTKSGSFSTRKIPDSVFAIPADYRKVTATAKVPTAAQQNPARHSR